MNAILFTEQKDLCLHLHLNCTTHTYTTGITYKTYNTIPNKNRGAVVNRAIKKRGYLHCLRNVTLLPFSKYTEKGVSDYILCIARV